MPSLLIVGSNQHGTLESSYARAFTELGWRVQFWHPAQMLARVVRGGRLGRLFSTFVHVEPWVRTANLSLLRQADKLRPQLILVIGTTGVRAGTLAQIKVRSPKTLIYCIYPDSPHLLDGDRIHCLPIFDRVTTSSPAWVTAFKQLGAKRVDYLPFAADTALHYPVTITQRDTEFSHDITFIGNWRFERETLLEQLTDLDLKIWGPNYWKHRVRPKSPLKACWGGRELVGEAFSRACAHSKILLNIMDVVTWPGPNMRTFELPACLTFALTERTPAILDFFTEGETIECFESVDEARDKIQYYLTHTDARQRIAEASYRFVLDHGHTYRGRAIQLINWIEQNLEQQGQ